MQLSAKLVSYALPLKKLKIKQNFYWKKLDAARGYLARPELNPR